MHCINRNFKELLVKIKEYDKCYHRIHKAVPFYFIGWLSNRKLFIGFFNY